jgi:hypothetical protein
LQTKEHPNHQILKTGKCRTRDQVFEGAEIMGRTLPILIHLMMDDYQRDMHRDGTAVVKGPYQKTAHKRQHKRQDRHVALLYYATRVLAFSRIYRKTGSTQMPNEERLNHQTLKARQRQIRDHFPHALCLRTHRALSRFQL